MSLFEQALSHIAVRAEKLDGDYVKDGLIYCGKCNTPKETKIKIGDVPETIVRCLCECAKKEEEKHEQQAKVNARRESIVESIQDLASIGAGRMPRFSFDMCDGSNKALAERMKKYAKNFDAVYEKNIGLILYGNTGAGKTFFAECIADALIKNGRFALITSVSGIVNAMTANFNENSARLLNYIKNVDLLILDDYGTERDTSFMNEHLFDIIDARYTSGRPMIITTNFSPEAMKANTSIHVRRIIERLTESCVAIEVKGESRRGVKANEKIQQLQDIFREG